MVQIRKQFEDYARDRYKVLLEGEQDSNLVQILKEVSSESSPLDIIAVLEKYDSVAETVIPHYWDRRLDELNEYLVSHGGRALGRLTSTDLAEVRAFLNVNPHINFSGFEKRLNSEFCAKGQVAFAEDAFYCRGETIEGLDVKYA